MFDLITWRLLIEMCLDSRLNVSEVIGMDALVAVIDLVGQLPVRITQDRFPSRRIVDLVRQDVAAPNAGATACNSKRHSSFAFTQRVFVFFQSGYHVIAFHDDGYEPGKIPDALELFVFQFAWRRIEHTNVPEQC